MILSAEWVSLGYIFFKLRHLPFDESNLYETEGAGILVGNLETR